MFTNDLDAGIESLLIRFTDDVKLGRAKNTLEDRQRIQKDLDRLECWSRDKKMQFIVDKYKMLHQGKDNQKGTYRIGNNWLCGSVALK